MNAVWDAWVDPANTPGRATCEARMTTPRVLVEIIVITARWGSAQANLVRGAKALTLRLTLESELASDWGAQRGRFGRQLFEENQKSD
jgi:hypothetical protein